jgi:glutamyl-tRNA synthetase
LNEKVRVRFAPSPTGHLHIGGARTALFNWLYAKHNNGVFILRIEDTDRTRSTDEYIDSIIDGMKWLNLAWDEGPFRQTDRFDVYRGYADRLLEEGMAYHCYCSPEELEDRRKEALSQGKSLKYDSRCRGLKDPPAGRKPAIRFMMPQEGEVVVRDMIRGDVVFDNSLLDDLIIVRSDGTPTYNFTVVADDVDMNITHVIRGDDHLNNTPKQIHIYRALGYQTPVFAHLPMILGADKTRLSKRHGATSVLSYREMGYLPEALVNYLVRLGWSYGDQEVFTLDELIEHFSFDAAGKSAAVFNPEKLLWLNSQYIISADPDRLVKLVKPFLVRGKIIGESSSLDEKWLSAAVATLQERAKTLEELADMLSYYIADDIGYNVKARDKFLNRKYLENLEAVKGGLESLEQFSADELEKVFHSIAEKHGAKLGSIAQPVRVAVTGRTESPGIFEVLEVLGKDKTMKRLERAIRMIHEG